MGNIYKKLLFVSYHHETPLLADSVQNHRLLYHLSNKFNIEILYRSKHRIKRDRDNIGVWSPSFSILDRFLLKLFPSFRPSVSIDKFIWSLIAFLKICFRGGKYDAVLVTYEPYSIYIFPCLLRKYFKIKVISIFYDPLFDNLFFPQSSKGKYLRKQLEKKIINKSTKIIVNNALVMNALRQRYPKADIELVYLCGNDIPQNTKVQDLSPNMPLKIVHCGNIHGKRDLKCLNDIINALKKKVENVNEKVKFIFYGTCSALERERVINNHNDDIISFVPSIPQSEIPSVLASANVLLLIDPLEDGNFSFPSKLCEYIQSGKEILAITNRNSPSGQMLEDNGYTFCDGSNIELIVDFVKNIILKGKSNLICMQNRGAIFSPKVISEQYGHIILESVYARSEL